MSSKILIVEDEEFFGKNLERRLIQAGYQVSTALSSEHARSLFQAFSGIDLLIINVQMSGDVGFSLIDQAREKNPRLKVIVTSRVGQKDEVIQALRYGALDYFEKPIELDELVVSVQHCLRIEPQVTTGARETVSPPTNTKGSYLQLVPPVTDGGAPSESSLSYTQIKKKWSNSFEKEFLQTTLNRNGGNVSAAARDAKLDRSNFLRLLRKHGLRAEEYRKAA